MRFATLTRMADQLMTYKYVVKQRRPARTARRRRSCRSRVFGDNGSGMHCHQSLWKDGADADGRRRRATPGSRRRRAHYVGGLLAHAPALLAFCAPTTNSYRRLVPGYEAPVNLVYSQRNRSACVRIPIYSSSPKAKRIEFRCPDPTANPYLAFSAMLLAGLDGIERGLDPGAPADYDLFEESQRRGRPGAGLARRDARRARGRPRLPAQGRRLQRGPDLDLDRLEARARGRPGAAAAPPGSSSSSTTTPEPRQRTSTARGASRAPPVRDRRRRRRGRRSATADCVTRPCATGSSTAAGRSTTPASGARAYLRGPHPRARCSSTSSASSSAPAGSGAAAIRCPTPATSPRAMGRAGIGADDLRRRLRLARRRRAAVVAPAPLRPRRLPR